MGFARAIMKPSNKTTTNQFRRENKMDGKSLVFIITFVIAGVLALLGVYAVAFQNSLVTSPKVMMDFIFAGVLAVMAILQYKVFESAEKA